ncbi:uncharacterized protein LOC122255594 [Penaeus japonicus]|uniref:uncharacterized protein LOC122255594 n=1 Tax=Penaeus japonicus TaxID=27405 RepID=UPI001C70BE4E|nr:uncharacterized protein LOC122255594 [Penaeus japonicus]
MREAMLFERERSLAPGINICTSKYRARRRSGSSAGGVVVVALLSGSAGQGSPRLAQCQLRSRRGWCSRVSCAVRVDLVLFLLSRPGAMTDSATGRSQAPFEYCFEKDRQYSTTRNTKHLGNRDPPLHRRRPQHTGEEPQCRRGVLCPSARGNARPRSQTPPDSTWHLRVICGSPRSDVRARRLALEVGAGVVVSEAVVGAAGRCARAAAVRRRQDESAAPQDDELLVPVADRAADRLLPGDVQAAQRCRHGARPEPAGRPGRPPVPPLLLRPRAAREHPAAQDALAAVQPQGQVPHPGAPLALGLERALRVRRRAQEQVRRERRVLRH